MQRFRSTWLPNGCPVVYGNGTVFGMVTQLFTTCEGLAARATRTTLNLRFDEKAAFFPSSLVNRIFGSADVVGVVGSA
ncbi:unnamed protein product [Nippostrongylus brasiliensis]|uniref:Gamma-glutamyltranspeptidase n=1 Tax=Nippostrongylus brasiliensis TaxID=27835 RepID=A0A0N4YV50_NIPBR|nr:unnamed protein product [Nippostrongylus brasiliensis]